MIALHILKIAGIILLILLLLIIFIICVILFAPIHYRADADYTDTGDKYAAHGRVRWILNIIRADLDKDNASMSLAVKALFFKVYPRPERSAGALGERRSPEDSTIVKIKYKISSLYVKIKRIVYMLNDERDKEAVRELLLRVKKLLWHIRPRKLDIRLRLGLDDPALTGEITGIICSFYPVYTSHLHLEPDFDKKVIDGDAHLKGHIQLIFVLIAAIRIYFDRDVRRLYRQIQKLRE